MSEPAWTFESTTTTPKGITVTVTVSVPEHHAWPRVQDTAEIIQMATTNVINHMDRTQKYE